MKPLRLEEVWRILPPLDELRPVLDLLAARSAPDPARTWSGSGELDTVGGRLVPSEGVGADGLALALRMQEHLARVYTGVGTALQALVAGDGEAAVEALLDVASAEEGLDRAERAAAWARSAHMVARDLRDRRHDALALRRWGRALRSQGRYAEALQRYRESLEILRLLDAPREAAEAAVGAGNVLEDQGLWADAEALYREALTFLDESGQDAVPERWHALLNLHITLRSRGHLEESIPWLEEAERVADGISDPAAPVFVENARGQLAMARGRHAEAEGHFRTALESAPAAGAKVVVRLNLAEALLARDRLLDAAEEARGAELEAVSAGAVPRLPEIYRLLGRVAAAAGNPDAFVLFERALEITRDRELPDVERARTLQAYAETEARLGRHDESARLMEEARAAYAELGIVHARHPWAEYHGPGPANPTRDLPESHGADHE